MRRTKLCLLIERKKESGGMDVPFISFLFYYQKRCFNLSVAGREEEWKICPDDRGDGDVVVDLVNMYMYSVQEGEEGGRKRKKEGGKKISCMHTNDDNNNNNDNDDER